MYSSTHSLTPALDGGEWSASRPGRFTPREGAPSTHWRGGWVDSRAVLDAVVKRKISSPRRESNLEPLSSCPWRSAIPAELSRLWTNPVDGQMYGADEVLSKTPLGQSRHAAISRSRTSCPPPPPGGQQSNCPSVKYDVITEVKAEVIIAQNQQWSSRSTVGEE
jgi:hypothetical protein